jgi:hypothetical protein
MAKEAWARALGAEVQAAGGDWRLELVDLHHLSDDLPHAVVRALLS